MQVGSSKRTRLSSAEANHTHTETTHGQSGFEQVATDCICIILTCLPFHELYCTFPRISKYFNKLAHQDSKSVVNLYNIRLTPYINAIFDTKNDSKYKSVKRYNISILFKLKRRICVIYWLPKIFEENMYNYGIKGIRLNNNIRRLYPIQPSWCGSINNTWFASMIGATYDAISVRSIIKLIGSTYDWSHAHGEERKMFLQWILEHDSEQTRKSIILETKHSKTRRLSNVLTNFEFIKQLITWPSYKSDIIENDCINLMFDKETYLTNISVINHVLEFFVSNIDYKLEEHDSVNSTIEYAIQRNRKQESQDLRSLNQSLIKLFFDFVEMVIYPSDEVDDLGNDLCVYVFLYQCINGNSNYDEYNSYGSVFRQIISHLNVLIRRSYDYYYPNCGYDTDYELTQYISNFDGSDKCKLEIYEDMIIHCLE